MDIGELRSPTAPSARTETCGRSLTGSRWRGRSAPPTATARTRPCSRRAPEPDSHPSTTSPRCCRTWPKARTSTCRCTSAASLSWPRSAAPTGNTTPTGCAWRPQRSSSTSSASPPPRRRRLRRAVRRGNRDPLAALPRRSQRHSPAAAAPPLHRPRPHLPGLTAVAMIVRWAAFEDSRGACGHAHETVAAAWRCAAGDERDHRRTGRRHSDRTVHAEAATEAASRVVALRPTPSDPPTRTDLAPLLRAAAAAIRRVCPADSGCGPFRARFGAASAVGGLVGSLYGSRGEQGRPVAPVEAAGRRILRWRPPGRSTGCERGSLAVPYRSGGGCWRRRWVSERRSPSTMVAVSAARSKTAAHPGQPSASRLITSAPAPRRCSRFA